MKSDDDAPTLHDAPRRNRLRAGLLRAGALAGLALTALLALVLATLLALIVVRVGADWLDGRAFLDGASPLSPRRRAMRELALDVIRQILLAALVIGAVRWQDGAAWRRTLALAPAAPATEPGLSPRRFGLILLLWPMVHITWVTSSADLLRAPIGRHASLSPILSTGGTALWFAYVLLLAPVAEELLIRGALFARVRPLLSAPGTIVLTGLVFAVAHLTPAGIARPVTLIPLALMLGWVRWRSGRLWPCILLHAWSNLAMIAYVLWPSFD